jgi:hypothetical protein
MENEDIIEELKREIARLRSDLDILNGACKSESENTTGHIKYIYKYLKLLDDRGVAHRKSVAEVLMVHRDAIAPIEEKIFPGVNKARGQLATIMENQKPAAQPKDEKEP